MGKYLFFDIDGTVLSDVTHTVPRDFDSCRASDFKKR